MLVARFAQLINSNTDSALSDFQSHAQSQRLCCLDFKCFERNHIYTTVALGRLLKTLKEYCEIPPRFTPTAQWAFPDLLADAVQAAPGLSVHTAGRPGTSARTSPHPARPHAPSSKPRSLNGRLAGGSQAAGQYSNPPKRTDSSCI